MPFGKKKGKKKEEQTLEAEVRGPLVQTTAAGEERFFFVVTAAEFVRYEADPAATGGAAPTHAPIRYAYAMDLQQGFDDDSLSKTPKCEFQFVHQGETIRLCAETPESKKRWFYHIEKRVRTLQRSAVMVYNKLQIVENPSAAMPKGHEVWAFIVSGSIAFGNLAGTGPPPAAAGEPEPQEEDVLDPGASLLTELELGQIVELQDVVGADEKGLSFSFQLYDMQYTFRADTKEDQRHWMHALRQELAAAEALQDDAVDIIYNLTAALMEEAPLLDEDIHYLLFFESGNSETEEEQRLALLEKSSFKVEKQADGDIAKFGAKWQDEMTPITLWLNSLGIRKFEEYASVMEQDNELEMEDLQYVSEKNLMEMGITAIGPRNRIMRAIAFMKNKNRDPTIPREKGKVTSLQFQFYMPFSDEARSIDVDLSSTVEDLKRKLIESNRQLRAPKSKPLAAKEFEKELERFTLQVVPRLGHWDEVVVLDEDALALREVPFIFYCFNKELAPRLQLRQTAIGEMKEGSLNTIVTSGYDVDEGEVSFGQFGHSPQLKFVRKLTRSIAHLVDHERHVEKGDSGSRKAELCARSLLASQDLDVVLADESPTFMIQVFPVQTTRFESLPMQCNKDTTARQVVDDFIAKYEGGRWGKMLSGAKLERACIKRHNISELLYDDDKLVDYDFIRLAIRTNSKVKLTLGFSHLVGEMRSWVPGPMPKVPDDCHLLLRQLSWMSAQYRSAIEDELDEPEELVDELGEGSLGFSEELVTAIKKGKDYSMEHLQELARNPLCDITDADKVILWRFRTEKAFTHSPRMLAKVILSVPSWEDQAVVHEAHQLIDSRSPNRWVTLSPAEALQLLDVRFWDDVLGKGTKHAKKCDNPNKMFRPFRDYAVRCLERLTDSELIDYMLELTQLLQYESLQQSALMRFLLYRALRNPFLIGQTMYWQVRAEMANDRRFILFGLFLRQYLDNCGVHREEIMKQEDLVQQLRVIARQVKDTPEVGRLRVLRNGLRQLKFPEGGLRLPVNPNMEVTGILVEKCKYMDSAKKPLWLAFKNADPSADNILVIFKDGDDVRQDMLCLQMFKLMQKLWADEGLDIPLVPYGCVTLAHEVGMLEVVLRTNTLSNITKDKAGSAGVWDNTILDEWLRSHNPTPEMYEKAVENFITSCAGYCVATYVLGIADRHNDNILLAETGHLVHIDFGHILGHVKTFMGVNRDKSPFILTDDFLVIMGGKEGKKSKNFERFQNLCCKLFNTCRKHANLFINLMSLMFAMGLPELQTAKDLNYMREVFVLDQTEAEAAKTFKKLIDQSLNTLMTKINWTAHILAHS